MSYATGAVEFVRHAFLGKPRVFDREDGEIVYREGSAEELTNYVDLFDTEDWRAVRKKLDKVEKRGRELEQTREAIKRIDEDHEDLSVEEAAEYILRLDDRFLGKSITREARRQYEGSSKSLDSIEGMYQLILTKANIDYLSKGVGVLNSSDSEHFCLWGTDEFHELEEKWRSFQDRYIDDWFYTESGSKSVQDEILGADLGDFYRIPERVENLLASFDGKGDITLEQVINELPEKFEDYSNKVSEKKDELREKSEKVKESVKENSFNGNVKRTVDEERRNKIERFKRMNELPKLGVFFDAFAGRGNDISRSTLLDPYKFSMRGYNCFKYIDELLSDHLEIEKERNEEDREEIEEILYEDVLLTHKVPRFESAEVWMRYSHLGDDSRVTGTFGYKTDEPVRRSEVMRTLHASGICTVRTDEGLEVGENERITVEDGQVVYEMETGELEEETLEGALKTYARVVNALSKLEAS